VYAVYWYYVVQSRFALRDSVMIIFDRLHVTCLYVGEFDTLRTARIILLGNL